MNAKLHRAITMVRAWTQWTRTSVYAMETILGNSVKQVQNYNDVAKNQREI